MRIGSVIICALALTVALSFSAQAESHVENISLKKQGEFVELTVYTDGPFVYSHSIVEAKAGKPFRVILDLKDCLHKLPQFNYRELPTETIDAVRTSQFQVNPEKVVRIVADVNRPVTYMVRQSQKRVTLVFAVPDEKEFQFWCAQPLSESEKIKLALAEPEGKEKIEPGVDPDEVLADNDSQAPAKGFKPPKTGEIKATEDKAKGFKPREVKEVTADTETKSGRISEVGLSAQERNSLKEKLAQLKNSDEKDKQDSEKTAVSEKKTQPKTYADASAKADKKQAPTVKSETPKTVQKKQEKARQASPSKKVDDKKTDSEASEKQELSDSQPVSPVLPGKNKFRKPTSPVKQPPAKNESEEQPEEGDKQKSDSKDMRKNPDRPPKTKGTLAAALPTREIVKYRSFGRRDPFMPLVSKSASGFQSGGLPDVETLRLVGILKGDRGSLALLEDMEGYGYIVQDGDKVKNGYVVQIYQNKILFQIHEYGWSRSVALSIDSEE